MILTGIHNAILSLILVTSTSFIASPALADSPTPKAGPTAKVSPSSTAKPAIRTPSDLAKVLDVSGLTLEMTESSYKLTPSPKTLSELIAALERFLANKCVSEEIFRSLKYDGNPSDPLCKSRMDRLLALHPQNPVGICLRDGLDSETCRSAAQQQLVAVYDGSQDTETELLDPQLKAGLPGKVRARLEQQRAQVKQLNQSFGLAQTPEQKDEIKGQIYLVYDNMLSSACAVASIRFVPKAVETPIPLPPKVEELKKNLGKIPPAMLADYQKQMLGKLEEELANSRGSATDKKVLLQMIEMVQNPELTQAVAIDTLQRTRFILPQCNALIGQIIGIDASLPQPTCHKHGWFSPQCLDALRAYKRSRQAIKAKKAAEEGKTGDGSLVSSF